MTYYFWLGREAEEMEELFRRFEKWLDSVRHVEDIL